MVIFFSFACRYHNVAFKRARMSSGEKKLVVLFYFIFISPNMLLFPIELSLLLKGTYHNLLY